MTPSITRRRNMWLAAGSIWLVAVSAVFAALALIVIDTPAATWALAVAVLTVIAIVACGSIIIRRSRVEPLEPAEPGLGRRFTWIVGIEVAAFAIVNSWAAATGRFSLIPSLDLIIIGLHFFPLARLFQVPRYNLLAIGFCAIPVITLVWFPPDFLIGHAESWYVVPSLGCGFVAAIVAAASLNEAWRSVGSLRPAVSSPG